MRNHRPYFAFALACLTALATSPSIAKEVDTAAEEQAIRHVDAAWSKNLQSKNLDAVMENYAEDAAFLVPNQPIIVGKEKIRDWFKARIATPGYTATFAPTKIVVSSAGDMAYELGTFAASAQAADGSTARSVGKHLVTWEKRNGRWLVAAEAISTDSPPPPRK
ncbi:YybH family protein [Luteimonas gilva]|uniref:YybH family protein n=1 Tax=Luteimonas gilva TaxID=2572684 RepID=UPI001678D3C2|nr:DUF4440 domain-containing protein [Luteimonas gilva]